MKIFMKFNNIIFLCFAFSCFSPSKNQIFKANNFRIKVIVFHRNMSPDKTIPRTLLLSLCKFLLLQLSSDLSSRFPNHGALIASLPHEKISCQEFRLDIAKVNLHTEVPRKKLLYF